jgi:hypothetical protein
MAASQQPLRSDTRPRPKTPAERAVECAAVQRRLKEEAAERREQAVSRSEAAARPPAAAGSR